MEMESVFWMILLCSDPSVPQTIYSTMPNCVCVTHCPVQLIDVGNWLSALYLKYPKRPQKKIKAFNS